jgi:hypothetical protein
MPTKKRKSTIQIPFHNQTGDVPHWADRQSVCITKLAEWKAVRDAGFQNPMRYDGKPTWKDEADWLNWIGWQIRHYDYQWRVPAEFDDTMKILGYGRGRSAAYLELESMTTGMKSVMMMTDMTNMIMNANIYKGVVAGRWIFGKRGQNYGIQYIAGNNEESGNN